MQRFDRLGEEACWILRNWKPISRGDLSAIPWAIVHWDIEGSGRESNRYCNIFKPVLRV